MTGVHRALATRRGRKTLAAGLLATVLLAVSAVAMTAAGADPVSDRCARVRDEVASRTELLDAAIAAGGLTSAERSQVARERRINAAAMRNACPAPSPSPSASASPTASPTISPTPSPPPPPPASWPGPDNTGVPAGTTLTTYTGPCTITIAGAVIDAKTVNCDLAIRTTGVVIKRSRVNGVVSVADGSNFSFALVDSEVDAGHRLMTGVGADNFTVLRADIVGGNRGVFCRRNCEVRDSWIHGTHVESDWHASAARASQGSTFVHNTLACDWLIPTAQDGGCSADLTMYPDFEPVRDVLVEGNLFVANPTGAAFCAYGGATSGKPYSNDPDNATGIVFRDNVFQRGPDPARGECAHYGPIDSYAAGRTGNQWTGNRWDDDGTPVNPT